jgi:hypothetical protein|nr:MAG TPA: head to tail connecting protein [Caudoviricetes sp.]
MSDALAEKIKKRFLRLKAERNNFQNLWQDASELVLPRKADFTVRQSPGAVRTSKIFDTTATNAAELLAAAMHGMMTNPSMPWFTLRFAETALNENAAWRPFLNQVTEVIRAEINRPEAGFVTNIHELYLDLAVLGTAAFYVGWNDDDRCFDFRSVFLNEIYIDEDERGFVDTVYRSYRTNARRLVRQFGEDRLPAEIKAEDAGEKSDVNYEVIHALFPNREYDRTLPMAGINRPFRSVYILADKGIVLDSGYYDVLPILVVRWTKSSSEVYGRSPAISALPDIKMLQTMMRDTLEAAAKANNPPYFTQDENSLLPRVVLPGQSVYVETMPVPMKTAGAFPITDVLMEATRQRIRVAFFNDQLQLTGGARMTATEVIQRTEEKRRLMGPILGRLEQELLSPLIMRVFSLLVEKGIIALPSGGRLPAMQVEYVSPLSMAQKQETAQTVVNALSMAAAVAQTVTASGSVVLKADAAQRKIMAAYGLEDVIRSEEEVASIEEAQAEAVSAQAQTAGAAQALELGQMANEVERGARENDAGNV